VASNFNPYQPPAFEPEPSAGSDARGAPLASRTDRLLAATIDMVVDSAVLVPIGYLVDGEWNFPLYGYGWMAAAFIVWTAIHGYFIVKSSQTIGKRLLRLKVVNFSDGQPTPAVKIVFLRKLPMNLLGAVPIVGGIGLLIGIAFIFGPERRCIHDIIAGTKVVQLGGVRSLRL